MTRPRRPPFEKIRGDDLKPETRFRAALDEAGVRYRRNDRGLPGSPDVVLEWRKVAVFVHGCYWHACSRHWRLPKTNPDFWAAKAKRNRQRDARASRRLRAMGYSVLVVWEHDLKRKDGPAKAVARVRRHAARRRSG